MPRYHIQTLIHIRWMKRRVECRFRFRNEMIGECGYTTTLMTDEQLRKQLEQRDMLLHAALECCDTNEPHIERSAQIEQLPKETNSRII